MDASWSSHLTPFFKMAVVLHKRLVLVIDVKSVGRFEWSWCPFACFKGCWNHILQLCSPSTCNFLTLCCTSSLVFCESMSSVPFLVSRLVSAFIVGIVWSLAVGLAARSSYLSIPGFAFSLFYPSLIR